MAVTFDPLPREVLAPDRAPKRLTTVERRVELLRVHGADEVRVLAFSREMAGWSPEEFIERVLVDELKASAVVVGENFRFGSQAAGDVDLLRSAGIEAGFAVEGLVLEGGAEPFSSTLVRAHVAAGRLPEAAAVLGRPHEVSGVVVEGDRRGRSLGFPTANVPVDDAYAVPPDGVYAGRLDIGGEVLPAAISVGTNPTFDGHDRRVESYVIDRPSSGGTSTCTTRWSASSSSGGCAAWTSSTPSTPWWRRCTRTSPTPGRSSPSWSEPPFQPRPSFLSTAATASAIACSPAAFGCRMRPSPFGGFRPLTQASPPEQMS